MCEVLDRIEKKGREEGIKEGIEQGILSERERMIRMIYKRGYSVEQISEIVEMPEQAVKHGVQIGAAERLAVVLPQLNDVRRQKAQRKAIGIQCGAVFGALPRQRRQHRV